MSNARAAQLLEAGMWLRLSGDHEGARRLFEQALRLEPDNARARQLLEGAPAEAPPAAPPVPKTDPFAPLQPPPAAPAMEMDWGSATGFAPSAPPSPPAPPVAVPVIPPVSMAEASPPSPAPRRSPPVMPPPVAPLAADDPGDEVVTNYGDEEAIPEFDVESTSAAEPGPAALPLELRPPTVPPPVPVEDFGLIGEAPPPEPTAPEPWAEVRSSHPVPAAFAPPALPRDDLPWGQTSASSLAVPAPAKGAPGGTMMFPAMSLPVAPPPQPAQTWEPPPQQAQTWEPPPQQAQTWQPPPQQAQTWQPPPQQAQTWQPPPQQQSWDPPPQPAEPWQPPPVVPAEDNNWGDVLAPSSPRLAVPAPPPGGTMVQFGSGGPGADQLSQALFGDAEPPPPPQVPLFVPPPPAPGTDQLFGSMPTLPQPSGFAESSGFPEPEMLFAAPPQHLAPPSPPPPPPRPVQVPQPFPPQRPRGPDPMLGPVPTGTIQFSGARPSSDFEGFAAPAPMPPPRASEPKLAPGATSGWDKGSNPGILVSDAAPGLGAALDLVAVGRPAPPPVGGDPKRAEVETLLRGARDLLGLDDHTGAMVLIIKAQELAPNDPEVQALREKSERTLEAMFESKLGSLDAAPRVKLKEDEIIWLNLDHRAGFVLAQIDGSCTFEDLFSVSGMSRLDTARILAQLLDEGVIVR